jgi:two-component system nitrate/nitrite response regulator NarL
MIKCRVILVGNDRLFREGLSMMLESDELTVVRTSKSDSELLPLLTTSDEQPDLIMWDSPTILEEDVARWADIHREFPKIGVVVLTEDTNAESANRALAAGVRGILPKCISAAALSLSLRLIALGENLATVPSGLTRAWQETTPATPRPFDESTLPVSLSPRETEILRRLGEGSQNKVIARELDLAEGTVKVHIKTLLRKINVTNRTQAAIWGRNHNL